MTTEKNDPLPLRILEAMSQCSIVFVSTSSRQGRPVRTISQAVSRFGYSASDFSEGKLKLCDIIHKDDRKRIAEEIFQTLERDNKHLCIEYRIMAPDASIHLVIENSIVAKDETTGDPIIEGFIQPIAPPTSARTSDTDLSALEQKLMQQSRLLSEANLVAESARRAKSSFLANMSHEFRTPLNGILGLSDLLLDSETNPDKREFMAMIKEAGYRLLEVLNSLIAISDIDLGRTSVHPHLFAPAQEIAAAMRPLIAKAAAKGLEMTVSISPELPERLYGDIKLVEQILMHLVHNAIKFTPHGFISVNVSPLRTLAQGSESKVELLFRISDTGIGIPTEKHAEIFEEFSILEDYLNKCHSGAGLGLAISRRLVERLGGWIHVESAESQGSTFSFMVAFDCGQTPDSLDSASSVRTLRPLRRALVVEDDLINLRLLKAQMEQHGIETVGAVNGQEALELLTSSTFDLVLMDMQMPVLDGMLATRRIRTHDGSSFDPKIIVIALTAHVLQGDREVILSSGVDEYLPKPADWLAIRGVLSKFFQI